MQNATDCAAAVVRNGFSDYTISPISCNIAHRVILYCEQRPVNVRYDNELSDVKIQLDPSNSYHILQYSQNCEDGWFKIDKICINMFSCLDCNDATSASIFCKQQDAALADNVLINAMQMNDYMEPILLEKSQFALFWYMFQMRQDKYINSYPEGDVTTTYRRTIMRNNFVPLNGSSICKLSPDIRNCNISLFLHIKTESQMYTNYLEMKKEAFVKNNREGLLTRISQIDFNKIIVSINNVLPIRGELWSVLGTPSFTTYKTSEMEFTQYVSMAESMICEKPERKQTSVPCSQLYLTCDDGTCIHDSLVCDGHPHCLYGEDENNCQAICNDQNIDCTTQCHYDNKCICSDNFFQCLSGGCIPLRYICDQTIQCEDGSDEPPTCVYIRPEQLQSESVILTHVSSYVDTLVKEVNVRNTGCLEHVERTWQTEVLYTIQYNPPDCPLNDPPSDIVVPCLDWSRYETSEQFISLNHLCVHDAICHPLSYCRNGFHLLNCDHIFCNGKFKCLKSYCIPLSDVCNKVCDCPHCEEEKFCERLLCPGLLLIPLRGTGFSCSNEAQQSKHTVYKRQLIHQPLLKINDDFPVYVRIQGKSKLSQMINKPEIITYLRINYIRQLMPDADDLFERMFSIKILDISHNSIHNLDAKTFMSMILLELLDMSYNSIHSIPKFLLCSNEKLRYLSINNNLIAILPSDVFSHNLQLKQIMMENNDLDPLEAELTGPYPSLDYLSSDLPRFCCNFEGVRTCSPSFPTFMSCRHMITSNLQVGIAWCAGLSTSCLNILCLIVVVNIILKRKKLSKRALIVLIISINICISELLCSLCILSYSVFNVMYSGYFGKVVDQWRQSIECLLLESFFSVSAQSSLAFGVLITIHFAIHIPSIIRRKTYLKRTILIIMLIWLSTVLVCTTGQIVQRNGHVDVNNYFCLPFVTTYLQDGLQLGFHVTLLTLNFLSVCSCISLNMYILMYVVKQSHCNSLTLAVNQVKLRKFATRMVILILTSTFTWIPILILQILALSGYSSTPAVFLWTLIVSFCFNLILDPVLVLQSALKA